MKIIARKNISEMYSDLSYMNDEQLMKKFKDIVTSKILKEVEKYIEYRLVRDSEYGDFIEAVIHVASNADFLCNSYGSLASLELPKEAIEDIYKKSIEDMKKYKEDSDNAGL